MTKLSDTQLVILGAAAERADLSVLPLPDSLKLKGGALTKVMDALRNRGLIRVIGSDGGPERVVLTSEGMAAIGVEHDESQTPAPADQDGAPAADTASTPADNDAQAVEAQTPGTEADDAATGAPEAATAPTSAESDVPAVEAPAPTTDADGAAAPAKRKATRKAKATKAAPTAGEPEAATGAAPAAKPTPRAGTKQALMIDMLKRPEGATVEQIAAATGWQHHTIRGAISGALKKKLGLTVESIRIREVGPNKTGAKGSATVYRIADGG